MPGETPHHKPSHDTVATTEFETVFVSGFLLVKVFLKFCKSVSIATAENIFGFLCRVLTHAGPTVLDRISDIVTKKPSSFQRTNINPHSFFGLIQLYFSLVCVTVKI